MATMADKLFIDTNILVFANNALSPFNAQAKLKLTQCYQKYEQLWISRQVIREYLAAMSRINATHTKVVTPDILTGLQNLTANFLMAEDNEQVTQNLFYLLDQVPCGGKQVHDANIVATMMAHNIKHILTHNVQDFIRFNAFIQIEPLIL